MNKSKCYVCETEEAMLCAYGRWLCGKCYMKVREKEKIKEMLLVEEIKKEYDEANPRNK